MAEKESILLQNGTKNRAPGKIRELRRKFAETATWQKTYCWKMLSISAWI